MALKTFYNAQFKKGSEDKKKIVEAIDKENKKLARARDLLLNGDIEGEDYKEIKALCNERLNGLENRLSAILPDSRDYMTTFVDEAVDSLSNIDKLYKYGGVEIKRKIIGSIDPEKLTFSKNGYRTNRINSLVDLSIR